MFDERYAAYRYTGAAGVVANKSHILLERSEADNARVLEIGGAAMPHRPWIKSPVGEYVISDLTATIAATRQEGYTYHACDTDPDFSQLKTHAPFTRIIVSHCWEHMPEPEQQLLKWVELLSPNGTLSIALPCDPGLLWRLGQRCKARDYKRVYGRDRRHYDLDMSREHINAAQRLMKILQFYFPASRWRYWPFSWLRVVECNLVMVVQVSRTDFTPS